ncbi:MAG: hypothetical protein P8I74_05480, partial [Phycisphaerales bacterium]|nr:hypothetical protein [Phycisphaerales bacterium]
GGAGGGGTDSVFGGRVGDALTYMTVGAFAIYLVLAISLNLLDSSTATASPLATDAEVVPAEGEYNPDDVFIAPAADDSTAATDVAPASDDVAADPETPLDPDVPEDAPAPEQNETP